MPQSVDPFSSIFICYRRGDSGGYARALYERLSAHFGDEQIFMDLDKIEPGEDFVQVIEGAVGSCEVLLALIGRSWLTSQDEAGRRIDNPNDFVRVEIAAAFARDIRVIPVLVQGAQMPRPQDLPEALRPLSRRHAFDLSDQRWRQDVDQLVGTLERRLARQREARQRAAEEAAERQRREVEARRQAESEAKAQRQAEERERLRQAAAEAERQKLQAGETEQVRQEAEERERRTANEQANSAVMKIEEPAYEALNAPDPSAEKVLHSSFPASPSDEEKIVPPVTTPPHMSTRERAALIGVIVCTVLFISIWAFTRWKAEGNQVTANQNATPVGTSATGPQETQSPTGGAPQPPVGMVYVPGGDFTMGRDKAAGADEYEWPAHEVTIEPFFMDIYEVTRGDYKKCVDANQCPQPQGWTDGSYPQGTAHQPVTGVDWNAASAYAEWRSKRANVICRLPTEQEWEYAAHGEDGRLYPWGNSWQGGLANADDPSGSVVDVNSYPQGKSPFGVFNMVGNAWEWTASEPTAYPGGQPPPQPSPGDWRVIRGGSYQEKQSAATTTYRRGYPARGAPDYTKIGFRCVISTARAPAP